MEMLELLDKSLPDGSKLFVKLHQLVDCAPDYSSYKHIEAFPADIGTYAFLNCVDVLITDYSSVMIDFSASAKEVILFMYDHDEYMGSRGFYKDPAELPFTVFYDKDAFVEYLKKGGNDKPFSLPDDYIKEFIPYDKGDAAAKIIDEVFHGRDAIAEKCDHKENRDAERTVYVFSGFENPKTEKGLAEAAKKSGSVILLRQDKFSNPEALTLSQIAGDTPWAIAAPYMHLGFFEGISLEFKDEDKPEKYAKIFKRELNRVLPGIKIKDIVCLDDSFYAKAISCAFYGK
jgi:hypothetical protein